MDFIKNNKFCFAKRSINKDKIIWLGENIFKINLIKKLHSEYKKNSLNKTTNQFDDWAKYMNRHFMKENIEMANRQGKYTAHH